MDETDKTISKSRCEKLFNDIDAGNNAAKILSDQVQLLVSERDIDQRNLDDQSNFLMKLNKEISDAKPEDVAAIQYQIKKGNTELAQFKQKLATVDKKIATITADYDLIKNRGVGLQKELTSIFEIMVDVFTYLSIKCQKPGEKKIPFVMRIGEGNFKQKEIIS